MTRELRDSGLTVSRRRIARLMRENGLRARQRRRFKRTTDSHHAWPVAPNLLDQDFTATGPDKKWGADISYVWTGAGWVGPRLRHESGSRWIVIETCQDQDSDAMPEQALSAEIRVSEDRSTVSIGLAGAGGGAVTLRLNIDDLTKLIAALGNARQSMAVGRPMPPLKGQQIPPVYKPQWCIQPEPLSEGSALSFDHPAFGAVAFVVPREHVEAMVRLLRAHLGISRSTASKPNQTIFSSGAGMPVPD